LLFLFFLYCGLHRGLRRRRGAKQHRADAPDLGCEFGDAPTCTESHCLTKSLDYEILSRTPMQ
jgi:hypothetical protein